MHIKRVQVADLPDIATVISEALFDDDLMEYLCPYRKDHPTDYRLSGLRRTKWRFYSGRRLFVAVTDEQDPDWNGKSQVIGYAGIQSHKDIEQDSQWKGVSWDALERQLLNIENFFIWHLHLDKSISRANMNTFNKANSEDPFPNVKEYIDLHMLAIDPSHQRQGVGGALLRHTQEIARNEGSPVILVASRAGEGLYLKNGFKKVGKFNFGGDVIGEKMIWYPENTKADVAQS